MMAVRALVLVALLAGSARADRLQLESPSAVAIDAESGVIGESGSSRFLDFARLAHWLDKN